MTLKNNWSQILMTSTVKEIVKFFKNHQIKGSYLSWLQMKKLEKVIRLQLSGNTHWGSHHDYLLSVI